MIVLHETKLFLKRERERETKAMTFESLLRGQGKAQEEEDVWIHSFWGVCAAAVVARVIPKRARLGMSESP